MPNHWHLVVWPNRDGELSRFVGWLTLTHTQRWHAHRRSAGYGHVYQGRFKSFPIQEDEHFYTVERYVERNAVRANLVRLAEQLPWSSLAQWLTPFIHSECSADCQSSRRLLGWPSRRQSPGMPILAAARAMLFELAPIIRYRSTNR
jgi:putative transposase